MYKFLLLIGLTLSVSGNSLMAATIEVEMLNRLGKESILNLLLMVSQAIPLSGLLLAKVIMFNFLLRLMELMLLKVN